MNDLFDIFLGNAGQFVAQEDETLDALFKESLKKIPSQDVTKPSAKEEAVEKNVHVDTPKDVIDVKKSEPICNQSNSANIHLNRKGITLENTIKSYTKGDKVLGALNKEPLRKPLQFETKGFSISRSIRENVFLSKPRISTSVEETKSTSHTGKNNTDSRAMPIGSSIQFNLKLEKDFDVLSKESLRKLWQPGRQEFPKVGTMEEKAYIDSKIHQKQVSHDVDRLRPAHKLGVTCTRNETITLQASITQENDFESLYQELLKKQCQSPQDNEVDGSEIRDNSSNKDQLILPANTEEHSSTKEEGIMQSQTNVFTAENNGSIQEQPNLVCNTFPSSELEHSETRASNKSAVLPKNEPTLHCSRDSSETVIPCKRKDAGLENQVPILVEDVSNPQDGDVKANDHPVSREASPRRRPAISANTTRKRRQRLMKQVRDKLDSVKNKKAQSTRTSFSRSSKKRLTGNIAVNECTVGLKANDVTRKYVQAPLREVRSCRRKAQVDTVKQPQKLRKRSASRKREFKGCSRISKSQENGRKANMPRPSETKCKDMPAVCVPAECVPSVCSIFTLSELEHASNTLVPVSEMKTLERQLHLDFTSKRLASNAKHRRGISGFFNKQFHPGGFWNSIVVEDDEKVISTSST